MNLGENIEGGTTSRVASTHTNSFLNLRLRVSSKQWTDFLILNLEQMQELQGVTTAFCTGNVGAFERNLADFEETYVK